MNPYSVYYPSGVEWIGEIPEQWEVQRLVRSVSRSDKKVQSDEASGLPYVGLEHVEAWTGRLLPLNDQATPESISNYFIPGNVLFGKLRPYLAKAFCPNFEGLCSTEFLVLNPVRYDQYYLLYLMLTDGFVLLADSSTYGAKMPRANWAFVGSLPLPLPPLDEQQVIAAYLNRETECIDTLVTKQLLLIGCLEVYRAALITHTVTRGLPPEVAHTTGLDPSPRLKPSGVEWLGDVPEHWEMCRLKHVAVYRTSSVDKKTKEGELPVRLCNYTDVYYGSRIRVSACEFMQATASSDEVERFKLCDGDVLITKDSEDWRDIGIPALVDETADDFVCGYHLGVIRTGPALDADFLYCTMQAGAINQQLQVLAQGVTRFGLPNSAVRSVLLPLPPLDEQQAIAAYLNRETERIDMLIAQQRLLVERLQEYRTALITEAVTGKIDLRTTITGLVHPAGKSSSCA